ncbi:hypothetical protein O181_089474 [Austropuccinia psidii MF-1]|uniref:Uncharacterized protein n=1 Tax=Austropuccinia psidii MF-1 TaxID=1389203 RepID=A0A9Q3ITQ0_9BASI|nr:hypothetical protein [Austropuccinia psidii MF-1]
MTTRRGSQYSIQSDGSGLRGGIYSSKGKRKGNIPSGTESTQVSALSQRQVPEMPIISEPELEISMSNSNRYKSHSEGSDRHLHELLQAVPHSVQRQGLGNVASNKPRSDKLLPHPQKFPHRGGDSGILQWMESTVIQASNQKAQGVPLKIEGGKQGRSPSSFYQQASSQPTSPRREEEQEKELEETIFPKLQDSKNPKRCHEQCLQHGQNFGVIQRQRGAKNETTPFPKEINLSPDVLNTLTELKDSILALKDIKNSLLSLQEINNILSSLTKILLQNQKQIDNIKFMVENNKPKSFIKKDKSKEAFKYNTSNNNEQRKFHKCGGIQHLANNCLKKAKIIEIVETENHNDKEEESDSEKETEESETSESDEINIINAQINNIDIIYEVLDVNSNLPQVGTSDTNLTNVQDAKLYQTKPEKGMGYTAGKSSISIVMVNNQEAKVNLDTGAYCTCVGKSYLKKLFQIGKKNLYQYKVSNLVVQVRA